MAIKVLTVVTVAHLFNDMIQSMVVSIYPLLRQSHGLDYTQLGQISLTLSLTATVLQPLVGCLADRRPMPFLLCVSSFATLLGLLMLSRACTIGNLLLAAGMIGIGSAIFHPEASRVTRMASGGRLGLAQSVFQVGGNAGAALGPLMAVMMVMPYGQSSIVWLVAMATVLVVMFYRVEIWHESHFAEIDIHPQAKCTTVDSIRAVAKPLSLLGILVIVKYIYLAGMTNFYTFYLMEHFQVSADAAQWRLFVFLAAVAIGTLAGGPIGDRIGPRRVIGISFLGIIPFSILLPWVDLPTATVFSTVIGLTLSSAFSAILVYAQGMAPGRIGLISGLFFGLAFGTGGIAAAALGYLADTFGLPTVIRICSFLPLFGILTAFLSDPDKKQEVTSS
jgi:FSR family fosmidomycin resistance protein-like MFS transporter